MKNTNIRNLDENERDPSVLRAALNEARQQIGRLEDRIDRMRARHEDDPDDLTRWLEDFLPLAKAIDTPGASLGDRVEALANHIHNDTRRGCVELSMFLFEVADKLGRRGAWSSSADSASPAGRAA